MRWKPTRTAHDPPAMLAVLHVIVISDQCIFSLLKTLLSELSGASAAVLPRTRRCVMRIVWLNARILPGIRAGHNKCILQSISAKTYYTCSWYETCTGTIASYFVRREHRWRDEARPISPFSRQSYDNAASAVLHRRHTSYHTLPVTPAVVYVFLQHKVFLGSLLMETFFPIISVFDSRNFCIFQFFVMIFSKYVKFNFSEFFAYYGEFLGLWQNASVSWHKVYNYFHILEILDKLSDENWALVGTYKVYLNCCESHDTTKNR